jgi:hypothetical protein
VVEFGLIWFKKWLKKWLKNGLIWFKKWLDEVVGMVEFGLS